MGAGGLSPPSPPHFNHWPSRFESLLTSASHRRRFVFNIGRRADDRCLPLEGACLPVLGVGVGRGPWALPPGKLGFLHKKSCIFVHICMILVVIAIFVHRNRRQSDKILEEGTFAMSSPTERVIGGHVAPPPVTAPMQRR